MPGMIPKKDASTGAWTYPVLTDVLEWAGLHSIDDYIQVRRQTITSFIMNRPKAYDAMDIDCCMES